jgi:hypothetical protein
MSFIAAGIGLTLKLGRLYRKMRLAGILKARKQKSHCNLEGRTPYAMVDERQR